MFEKVNQPIQVEERRVSGLRFGDGRVQALWSAGRLFVFVANGFSAKELRPKLAALLGLKPDQLYSEKEVSLVSSASFRSGSCPCFSGVPDMPSMGRFKAGEGASGPHEGPARRVPPWP